MQKELKEVCLGFFSCIEIEMFSKALYHYPFYLWGKKGTEKGKIFFLTELIILAG